jgi:hypothetical protein
MPVYQSLRAEPRSPAPEDPRRHSQVSRSDQRLKPPPISPRLARSLARARARSRLEGELRAIARDALGPHQSDELPSDCAAWLSTTIEAAVASVCDETLAALAGALDSRLSVMPPTVARRLHDVELRHDAGYE